jgi:predicted deacylase
MGWYGLYISGSGQRLVKGSCEHGNELPGSIKCWEIIDKLRDWWLLKKDTA